MTSTAALPFGVDRDTHILGILSIYGPAADLPAIAGVSAAVTGPLLRRLVRRGHITPYRELTAAGQAALANRQRCLPGLPRYSPGLPRTIPGLNIPSGDPVKKPSAAPPRKRKLIHVKTLTRQQAVEIHLRLQSDVLRGNKLARTRLMVFGLSAFAGLRAGEIVGLNIGDVEASPQGGRPPVIRIRREITKSDDGVREVPLDWNRRFLEDLRKYLAYRAACAGVADVAQLPPESPLVISFRSRCVLPPPRGPQTLFDFSTEPRDLAAEPYACFGRRIDRDTARKYFRSACGVNIDLETYRITTHTGRHTFCSLAVAADRKLTQVKDAAGHSNISITSTYLHAHRDDSDDDCFGAMYTPAVSRPAVSTAAVAAK